MQHEHLTGTRAEKLGGQLTDLSSDTEALCVPTSAKVGSLPKLFLCSDAKDKYFSILLDHK